MSKQQVKRDCGHCGREFIVYGKYRKKFCSSSCQSGANNAKNYKRSALGLTTGTAGALGEMIVCCDLIKRGYAVFRAVSPSCVCDLISAKEEKKIMIEVTTGMKSAIGKVFHGKKVSSRFNMLAVVIHSDSSIEYFWNDGISLIPHTP